MSLGHHSAMTMCRLATWMFRKIGAREHVMDTAGAVSH
jgi:hypothetical protein